MKRIVLTTLAIVALAGVVVGADGSNGKKKKKKKDATHAAAVVRTEDRIVVVFATRDVDVIRSHYRGKHKTLPPGLARKYARTGQLPPGWQKKMQPFPPTIERTLPVLPRGYRRGVIDAHAVIYDARGVIVDVAVLF
jgi:Ni/Co efflux regulator RcnB